MYNRQDSAGAVHHNRIMCYKLELRSATNLLLYTYSFSSAAYNYTFRDSSTEASCRLPPPPSPPSPPPPRQASYVLTSRTTFCFIAKL